MRVGQIKNLGSTLESESELGAILNYRFETWSFIVIDRVHLKFENNTHSEHLGAI